LDALDIQRSLVVFDVPRFVYSYSLGIQLESFSMVNIQVFTAKRFGADGQSVMKLLLGRQGGRKM
jgi:hypothetical protein